MIRCTSLLLSAGALVAVACTKPAELTPDASAPAAITCGAGTHLVDGVCAADVLPGADAAEPDEEDDAEAPPPPPGKCPAAGNVEGLYAMDWSKQFPLSVDVAVRAKAIAGLAAETKALGTELELELRTACTKLAAELGTKGTFTSADLACSAATTALTQLRAKLAPAKIRIEVHAPVCTTPLESFGSCVTKCDAALDASAPETTCQGHAPVGKCTGICEGACEPQAGKCSGTCTGHCDSGFHGSCKGSCKGSCDGKDLKGKGECTGTCDGTCEGDARGECKGACQGGCTTHAEVCAGTCLGACSVDVKDAKCTGLFKATGAPDECRAYCETRMGRRAACGPAPVSVSVTGAKDATAAKTFEAALEHHLGAVARIGLGLAPRIQAAQNNAKRVTTGVKSVTNASDSEEIRAVTPCLSGFVGPATEGSLALKSTAAAAAALLAAAK